MHGRNPTVGWHAHREFWRKIEVAKFAACYSTRPGMHSECDRA